MRKLILHVGRHKSGTSSLQRMLCENKEELLEHGYIYPELTRTPIAHHLLANYLKGSDTLTKSELEEVDNLITEIRSSKLNYLLSSEEFQNIHPKKVHAFFSRFFDEIKIVVYLREQVSYLLSSYAQAIQNQNITEDIYAYYNRVFSKLSYLEFLEKWENEFSKDNLIVREFNRSILKNGDVRIDFLECIGIDNIDKFIFIDHDQNPTISADLIEFKLALNSSGFMNFFPRSRMYKILSAVEVKLDRHREKPSIHSDFLPEVIANFNKEKKSLNEKYSLQLVTDLSSLNVKNRSNTINHLWKIINTISEIDHDCSKKIIDSWEDIFSFNSFGLTDYCKQIDSRYKTNLYKSVFSSEKIELDFIRQTINQLLKNSLCSHDLVALATIVKMKFRTDPTFGTILGQIANQQAHLNLDIVTKPNNGVTMLSSTIRPDSEHFGVILGYSIPLILNEVDVNIILMSEMEWPSWKVQSAPELIDKYYEYLDLYLTKTNLSFDDKAKVKSSLDIQLSPRPLKLSKMINSCVVRFQGTAIFRTTHIFARSIMENCRVFTVLYSSAVKDVKFSESTIIRHNYPKSNEVTFHPPVPVNDTTCNDTFSGDTFTPSKLLTIYSHRRIKFGLLNMNENDWSALANLFRVYKDLVWKLIGASDPNEAMSVIPKKIQEEFPGRIIIVGVSNLTEEYNPRAVLLGLPGIAGAGGVGLRAIKSGMLVLTPRNLNSDLFNLVSNKVVFNNMSEIFKLLSSQEETQNFERFTPM